MNHNSVPAWLEGTSPSLEGKRFDLPAEPVRLGRGAACRIALSDPMVSREHAEIRRTEAGFVVVDLGSTHGVYVDGVRVEEGLLHEGSRIRLGDSEFLFRMTQDAVPTALFPDRPPISPMAPRPTPPPAPAPEAPSSGPAPGPAVAPASPPRTRSRRILWIACGAVGLFAVCGCLGVLAFNWMVSRPGTAYTSEDLALALSVPFVDERPEILENLGRPDEFDIAVVQVEGGQVRRESWWYYGFGTRVDFVDGVIVWTVELEPETEATIYPAWYDPTAFETGITVDEATALLIDASPAGVAPLSFDLSEGGEDLAGAVMLAGDQIILVFEQDQLVAVESMGAILEGGEG